MTEAYDWKECALGYTVEETLDSYSVGWEDGYQAGREAILKEKRATVARLILDGALWTVCLIVAINAAFQVGGLLTEDKMAGRLEAAIVKIEGVKK